MKNVAIKDDTIKPPLHLIDPNFLCDMAVILGYGENKYGDANWIKGLNYSQLISACLRHLAAFQVGKENDEETGLSHLAHAACSLMMLYYYQYQGDYEDDRRFKKMPSVRNDATHLMFRTKPSYEKRLDLSKMWVKKTKSKSKKRQSQDPVRILQHRIKIWADEVFPNRTAHNALCKLVMEEIPELLNGGLDDPMEYADVLILILDVASLRGIDAIAAAHKKMTVNESRSWEQNPSTGLMKHKGD